MGWLTRSAKGSLGALANFIWPARSLISNERQSKSGALDADAFTQIHFLMGTGCRLCGVPMPLNLGEETICAACLAKPPRWDAARAAIAYDDISRQAVLDLKHAGRRDGLATLGNWMILAGQDILETSDLIIPVPLHYRRLASRGYNQAGWLASEVGRLSKRPVLHAALKRTRATPSQGGLTARQRKRNVAGAFTVRKGRQNHLQEKEVTLIDDVFTTGSTLSACTRALKQAGVAKVNVLVLARVVREKDITI